MEMLTLTAGLLLPWLGGALWLMFIESIFSQAIQFNRLRQIGYGFFLGYAVLFLAIMAFNALTGNVSWAWIMVFLLLFASCGGLALRLTPRTLPTAPHLPNASLTTAQKALWVVLAAWMGLHLVFLGSEVFSQPLYPWYAWQTWVYRAKAWFLAGGMAEIVTPTQWATLTSPDAYTVHAWNYPELPSVIPYWAALSLGHWSETLVNLPVFLAGSAIGLGLYGQCREAGLGTLFSLTACYLLFSIPLFATHVALAGYADIWMAGFAGLGFMALIRGAVARQRSQTVLGLCMVALAMFVKNEGVVWFLAALLMLTLITLRWRAKLLAALALVAVVLVTWWLGYKHIELPLLGPLGVVSDRLEIPFVGSFALEVHNVWRVYWENFFTMGSWNLLWLLVGTALLLAMVGKKPFAAPEYRIGFIFILIFLATQLFIFGFTDQGAWADTYTAVNRLPLHFVPALIFAALVIVRARFKRLDGVNTNPDTRCDRV